jgi:hypothetical protein
MPIGRVFEHTEEALIGMYKPNGAINLEALIALPTLFMQEGTHRTEQPARVATIARARIVGANVALEYTFDAGIPTIPNERLYEFAADLDINEFEFSRTHWAIKNVDLFRTLFRILQPRELKPRVFHIADPEKIEPQLVSVMMPFNEAFNNVYATLKGMIESLGLRPRRADDIWENPAVIQDVVSLIDRARVVICDCTGRNPNVFYEAGIAHTLGRDVILITQSEEDIPFDLRHLRFVKYLNNGEGLQELAGRLRQRLGDLV